MTEIRVPTLGESVTEATIGKWFKKPGDAVAVDEPLVELETDKVTIEVPAPAAGTLSEIAAEGRRDRRGRRAARPDQGRPALPPSGGRRSRRKPPPKRRSTAAPAPAAPPKIASRRCAARAVGAQDRGRDRRGRRQGRPAPARTAA